MKEKVRPTVAVAIVDTEQYKLASNALIHSINNFKFDQVIIFSDDPSMWGGFQINTIKKISSIDEYNFIITKVLPEKLHCDFVLIIQFDGFILNPEQFTEEFFDYDYIGAPWPQFENCNVGNGGFSLRSKKLVDRVAQQAHESFDVAEDLFICRYLQLLPEFQDIKFAPKELAEKFSVEFPPVPFKSFGFHGIFHLPNIYANNLSLLIENLSPNTIIRRFDYLHYFISIHSDAHGDQFRKKFEYIKNNKIN